MTEENTPAEFVVFATMKRAVTSIRLNLGAQLRRLTGLSLVQFEILLFLEQSPGGLRMHELADAVGLSRSGLTYQVGQLEERGWVRRVPDERNPRAVTAVLTDAGRGYFSGLQQQHLTSVREHAFSGLTTDDLATMSRIFTKIAASVTGAAGAPGAQTSDADS